MSNRYDFTIKEIDNGHLLTIDIPGKPNVNKFYESETEAWLALKLTCDHMLGLHDEVPENE